MGKKSQAKKRRRVSPEAFRAVAAELTASSDKYSNVVICPLCTREFAESDIDELSRDHVIPEALGGTITTITCKSCNNGFGHKAEHYLSRPFQMSKDLFGDKGLTGKLTIEGHTFPALIKQPANQIPIMQIKTLGGPPAAFSALQGAMSRKPVHEWSFSHHIEYRSDRAVAAIAKAAYLAVFRQLGYRLMFSPAGEAFRMAIISARDGRSELLQPLVTTLAKVDKLLGEEPQFAAFGVQIGDRSFTFVLLLFRSGGYGYWTCVILPDYAGYPEGTFVSESIFEYLVEAKKLLETFHIQMQGDGEGGAFYQFHNPSNNSFSTEVHVGPHR